VTTLEDVLSRNYTFIAKADLEDGGWVVMYPDLPGVMTQAETYEEVAAMAKDALRTWAEAQIEDGRPIPEPSDFAIPEWDWDTAGEPLITTADVAKEFEVTPRRVLALAKDRGVGRRYGRSVMFTKRDVDRLRPGASGRPRKVVQ
jgi:predicted RNase H-like HicB family nuclease